MKPCLDTPCADCGSRVRSPSMKVIVRIVLAVLVTVFVYPCAVLTAVRLMLSAWCAFTWGKFTMFDYGVYTNMIWNSGHGEWFKVLVNDSYLNTHLSFTLALLGPLFRVWDHPLLLSVVQWLFILSGAAIVFAAARRNRVPVAMSGVLLLFCVGYRFTQGVMLSEFHGISIYYLLVPWLYYCCSFRKSLAWVPLVLILGVREEAFIFILPLLLYFAVKDRWAWGYVFLAVAIIYGVLAILWLYPALTGIEIADRRKSAMAGGIFARLLDRDEAPLRITSLVWTLLPAFAVIHRKSAAAFVIPIAALLTAVFSGYPTQIGLGSHYGGPVAVCLQVGLLEAVSLRTRRWDESTGAGSRLDVTVRACVILGLVLAFNFHSGFLFGGPKNYDVYREPSLRGRMALRAARQLPKQGVLVTDNSLSGYCANRENILVWKKIKADSPAFEVVFTLASAVGRHLDGRLVELLKAGDLGVRYYDGEHVILQRGYDTSANGPFLDSYRYGPIAIPLTPKHGGEDMLRRGRAPVRYWEGDGHRAPITLSYGGSRHLDAGRYEAVFRYRAVQPRRDIKHSWGWFSVHVLNEPDPLVWVDIHRLMTAPGTFTMQRVPFEIHKPASVEIRVTGGDAELWLDSVMFVPPDRPSLAYRLL